MPVELAQEQMREPVQAPCSHTLYSDWVDETVMPHEWHHEEFVVEYRGVSGFWWNGEHTNPVIGIDTIGIIELSYTPGDLRVKVNGELIRQGCGEVINDHGV